MNRQMIYPIDRPRTWGFFAVEDGGTAVYQRPISIRGRVELEQPECASFVLDGVPEHSVYSVVDDAGVPVHADEWNASGGAVEVSVVDQTLFVKVRGAKLGRGPYELRMPTGPASGFESLRVMTS